MWKIDNIPRIYDQDTDGFDRYENTSLVSSGDCKCLATSQTDLVIIYGRPRHSQSQGLGPVMFHINTSVTLNSQVNTV